MAAELVTDSTARKQRPIARGVLDYFPLAMAEIANVSFVGNEQHNPGEPMHWAKDKSPDHADCIVRHLIERGTLDTDGLRHTAKVAWRALALLQIELETGAGVPRIPSLKEMSDQVAMGVSLYDTSDLTGPQPPVEGRKAYIFHALTNLGCDQKTAAAICGGVTFSPREPSAGGRFVYVAGPMRGYPDFNFPQFDAARDYFLSQGFHVISPADIDRAAGDSDGISNEQATTQAKDYLYRDFFAIFLMMHLGQQGRNAIGFLPKWETSTGAFAEFAIGRWLHLNILDATTGQPFNATEIAAINTTSAVQNFLLGQLGVAHHRV